MVSRDTRQRSLLVFFAIAGVGAFYALGLQGYQAGAGFAFGFGFRHLAQRLAS